MAKHGRHQPAICALFREAAMSRARTKTAQRPAFWAQALLAGSVLVAAAMILLLAWT
jgi:hypothetical protein